MGKTRQEVVDAFMRGDAARGGSSLWSTGDTLMSYGTCIAQWDGKGMIINRTKYSKTTSAQQSMIPVMNIAGKVKWVEDIPRGAHELKSAKIVA